MEIIDPIQNQEISSIKVKVGLNKLNQSKKKCPERQTRPSDTVVTSRIVKAMNYYLNTIGRSDVKIKVYKENGEIIARVMSKEHGTLINTIRPEKLLSLNTAINGIVGLLVNAKV